MSGNAMDDIYRIQRHFYDFTRKPYLLGRDVLIRELDLSADETVLEIGCGTARNLFIARACWGASSAPAIFWAGCWASMPAP